MDCEQTAGERAVAYWFADGLPELLFGAAMTAGYGGGLVWRVYLHQPWVLAVGVAGFVFLLFLLCSHRRIIEFFKSRITYPRTGYVAAPTPITGQTNGPVLLFGEQPRGNTSSFPFLVVNAGVLAGGWFRLWNSGEAWTVFAGTLALAILLYAFGRMQPYSYSIASLVPLVACGAVAAYLHLPRPVNRFAPELLCSLWLLSRGMIKLALYLWKNPQPSLSEGQSA